MRNFFLMCWILTALVFSSGCSKEMEQIDLTVVQVDPKASFVTNLNEVIDSVEYIVLRTPDSVVIGYPSVIQIEDREIFVLDRDFSNRISRFNRKGEFLNQIGNIGRGPGEYEEPQTFSVNDSLVYISAIGKMLCYSTSGNLIFDFKNIISARDFSTIPEGGFAFYSGFYDAAYVSDRPANLYTTDSAGTIRDASLFFDPKILNENATLLYNNFSGGSDELLFTEPYCDTVYRVKLQQTSPAYFIKYTSGQLPDDFKSKYLTDKLLKAADVRKAMIDKGYCKKWGSVKNLANHLYFMFEYGGIIRGAFYSKSTGVVKQANERATPLEGAHIPYSIGFNQWSTDNYLIGLMDPYQLSQFIKTEKLTPEVKALNLTANENMVVRLTYLKRF